MRIMEKDIGALIRELSEIYDENSQDTFITLYLKKDALDEKFLKRRERVCISFLKGDEQRNFIHTKPNILTDRNINTKANSSPHENCPECKQKSIRIGLQYYFRCFLRDIFYMKIVQFFLVLTILLS